MFCRFVPAMGAIAETDSYGRPVWDIFIRGCVGPEQFTALPQNQVVIYSSETSPLHGICPTGKCKEASSTHLTHFLD